MKMIRFASGFVAATLAAPQVANALDDNEWYVSAGGTVSQLQDTEGTIANAPMPGITVRTENSFDTGFGGQIAVGRDLGTFRVEIEGGYARDTQDSYTAIAPPTGRIVADVKQETLRVMANAYFDITDGPVQPYIGAGLGVAQVNVLFVGPRAPFPTEAPRTLIDDSDSRFAYQLMGGISVPVSNRVALTLQYRWFDAGTISLVDSRNEAATRDVAGHNIDAGVRMKF